MNLRHIKTKPRTETIITLALNCRRDFNVLRGDRSHCVQKNTLKYVSSFICFFCCLFKWSMFCV